MRFHGFRFEDLVGLGFNGYLRLAPFNVLFGRNGAGKTRYLESIASFFEPAMRYVGRAGKYDSEGNWVYGDVDIHLHEALKDENWPWFRSVLTALDHQNDDDAWSGFARAVTDRESGEDDDDWEPDFLEHGRTAGEDARSGLFWERAVDAFSDDLADDHAGDARSLFLSLRAGGGLVSVQNFPLGHVSLAYDPAASPRGHGATCHFAARLTDGAPEGHVARTAAERILDAGDDRRPLLLLGVLPEDEAEYRRIALPSPEIVRIDVEPSGDIEKTVTDAVSAMLPYGRHRDTWLVDSDDGSFRVVDAVLELVGEVEDLANSLAPAFLLHDGVIRIQVTPPDRWGADGARCAVGFSERENDFLEVGLLGAGTRRWVAACVTEAARRAREAGPRGPTSQPSPGSGERLYLVDEPELHLHPLAQEDVATWLVDKAAEGDTVIVATHSPALLSAEIRDARLTAVLRNAGESVLYDMTDDLLGWIEEEAVQLGVGRGTVLQLTRAVLVVEGQHDVAVVRRYFGHELDRHRIRVFALRGTGNTEALIDSDYLGGAGIPLRVLLDDVRPEALSGIVPRQAMTPEEKKLQRLLQHLDHQRSVGHDVQPLPYDRPDIICALPPTTVRRAYPAARIGDWASIVDDWRRGGRGTGFKGFAFRAMGVADDPDTFVMRVLAHAADGETPEPALQQAMDGLVKSLAR